MLTSRTSTDDDIKREREREIKIKMVSRKARKSYDRP